MLFGTISLTLLLLPMALVLLAAPVAVALIGGFMIEERVFLWERLIMWAVYCLTLLAMVSFILVGLEHDLISSLVAIVYSACAGVILGLSFIILCIAMEGS